MLASLAQAVLGTTVVLYATIVVNPRQWVYRKDKVELAVTLANETDHPAQVLTGLTGNENFFFDLRLIDSGGQIVWTGNDVRFVDCDDQPAGMIRTIAAHGSYVAVLDWRKLFNLAPGRYRLSAVYRIEPDREPGSSGMYGHEIREAHAFVGRVESPSIEVTVLAK